MALNQEFPYHSINPLETVQKLQTNEKEGLTQEEAQKRLEKFGANELPEEEGSHPVLLLIKQFRDFLVLILIIAAAISWYADQIMNVWVILAVIIFNAAMGFIQEYKAEKAVMAIKKMVEHKALVIRNGEKQKIPATQIVPGDILLPEEGEVVAADARVIRYKNLQTTEASLTGEAMPVSKTDEKLEEDLAVGDRKNMIWKSTHVVRGSGKAVVIATGENSQIGKIATSLGEMKKTSSNFKNKTRKLGQQMAIIAILVSIGVFITGYFIRDYEFNEILLVTIASLVSAIPEGLPVVISIVLAIGARRMARRNAIIREFSATETLGSVSVIMTDKTGTITQNRLTIRKIHCGENTTIDVTGNGYETEGEFLKDNEPILVENDPLLKKMVLIGRYGNDASLRQNNGETEVTGDPTEVSQLVMSLKAGKTDDQVEVIDNLPFNSEQKLRATLVKANGKKELWVTGAPEKLIDLSKKVLLPGGEKEFTHEQKENLHQVMDQWAGEAMRIIGLASKSYEKDEIDTDDIRDLTLVGITGIIDPPRTKVKEAIAACKTAGIRVIMVTGDHKKTAAAIAREVGILQQEQERNRKYPEAISEDELDPGDENFGDIVENVAVFARISPNMKLKIAEALQQKGYLIAMTGDGVNDAPALKKADVGIAMGKRGTDVAREASRIVLSDDNFASIVNAIEEGRIVIKNIRSTSYFLLTTNVASTLVIIVGIAAGWPLPLTATQILWVNIVTDGVMDVAKATEPGHGDVMDQPPVKKEDTILKKSVIPYMAITAIVMVTLTLGAFYYYLPQGEDIARTAAFITISMTQVFNAFNLRDLKKTIWKIGLFTNKWINLAFAASVAMQLAVVTVPAFREIFGFGEISMGEFFILTAMSAVLLIVGEVYKMVRYPK